MENRQHISLCEGKVYIEGTLVLDAVSLNFVYKPTVVTTSRLGSKGKDRRWTGRDITGDFTEYKSTNWLTEKVKSYENTGKTPELTIQGIRNDKNSDYFATYKKDEQITLSGCVLTGDIPLLELDTNGEVVQNTVSFGAKNMKIG